MNNGERIVTLRNRRGWTRRQLGSKVGLTLREMKAIETGKEPPSRKENRVFTGKFFDSLGYVKRVMICWPVRDKNFNVAEQQDRVLNFLAEVA